MWRNVNSGMISSVELKAGPYIAGGWGVVAVAPARKTNFFVSNVVFD